MTATSGTYYDPATGRIMAVVYQAQPVDYAAMAPAGAAALDGEIGDPETHYVTGGALVVRPELPGFDTLAIPADGVTAARLDLPAGASGTINGEAFGPHGEATTLEVVADQPGPVWVTAEAWPHRPFVAKVVAE